ncbi:MAG: helix-turn-helix transcriptional regulator [Bacteroides sp.]|nr:helix-turn-helix transcriptional regulator [Bacteroides sp.]
MKIVWFVLIISFCLVGFPIRGAEVDSCLFELPTSMLLIEGEKCLEVDSLEYKAATAFNLIVNRYYKNPTDTALRRSAVIALRHLGNLNLTHNLDYRKAYRNLHLARQIASDDGNEYQLAFILNSLASLYTSNIVDNDSVAAKADRLLLAALKASLHSNNQSLLPTVGINIAFTNFTKGGWGIFDKDIHEIEMVEFDSVNNAGGRTVKNVINATDAFFAKDYDRCENLLQQASSLMPHELYAERFAYTFDLFLMNLYLQRSDTVKAIATMKKILNHAERYDHNDYIRIMSYRLAKIYEDLGQKDSLEMYYNRYLNLNDVMRVENGYGEVSTMDLLAEVEEANKDLENISISHQKMQRKFILTISAFIIACVILIALLIIYRNLKRTNRNLFLRNEEWLKRENQHKLLREEWERDRTALETRISELTESLKSNSSSNPYDTESDDKVSCIEAKEEKVSNHYPESDNETYMRIYTRILKVMEENPAIFQSGFSLSDLAALLNVTPRTVSRSINICHNSNFPQLLNEYRMREVTRLLHDPEMDGWTIEAIGEKAGFKSRTAFSRLFKKMIGLTPSDYKMMIKDQKS